MEYIITVNSIMSKDHKLVEDAVKQMVATLNDTLDKGEVSLEKRSHDWRGVNRTFHDTRTLHKATPQQLKRLIWRMEDEGLHFRCFSGVKSS